MSHCGRAIAIICAFFGVFQLSLFIVSLYSFTKFSSSEKKAFNLLERLRGKDDMRMISVKMITTAYRVKKLKTKENNAKTMK